MCPMFVAAPVLLWARHCCLVRERSGGLYASSELAKRTAISKRSTAEGLADVVTSGACCE
jgi:hypothetical protein